MDEKPTPAPPTVESLAAEVARLTCLLQERTGPVPSTTPPEPATTGRPTAEPVQLDRRAALRRAGGLAAAAVAGGAVLVATQASPAAAATVAGSGNPGITATGLGGDGVVATTDTATKSAVYGHTAVATAYAGFFAHDTTGTALVARGTGGTASGLPVVEIQTDGRPGLKIDADGYAASFTGGYHETNAGTVVAISSGPEVYSALDISKSTNGSGVFVNGSANVVAFDTQNVGIGIRAWAETTAAELRSKVVQVQFQTNGTTVPTTRSTSHTKGALVWDDTDLWLCTASGTPGTWRKVGGSTSAGQFHVLPAPARVYDSRPGSTPAVGPKAKLAPNVARTLDLKVNASGVPAGATAALLTILLVNAANASANFTAWANGVAKPQANTMVWGGATGRFTATAVAALDSAARIQVSASAATDVVVDVVGFYR